MAKRVSDNLNGLASELDTMLAQTLAKTALEVKKLMLDAARPATGGDLKLSGVGARKSPGSGPKGAKLNVRYDQQRGSRGLAVRIRAVGQWQFIENPRSGGYRIPKAKRKRNNPGAHLHTGHGDHGWVTGPIKGGSKRGRAVWEKAAPKAVAEVEDLFVKAFVNVIERA